MILVMSLCTDIQEKTVTVSLLSVSLYEGSEQVLPYLSRVDHRSVFKSGLVVGPTQGCSKAVHDV